MTAVRLPPPVARRTRDSEVDVAALDADLRAEVESEVRFDAGSRAAYSTDSSNYRQVPIGVVVPRTVDAAVAAVAGHTFQRWFRQRTATGDGARGDVVLWPDTFHNHFHPPVAQAAVEVLEHAGWRARVPDGPLCCGLTWISTGQLETARRVLQRSVGVLRPHLRPGGMVLGLGPSCTAVFRADAPELLPHDDDVARLRRQTVTLAELLVHHTPGWELRVRGRSLRRVGSMRRAGTATGGAGCRRQRCPAGRRLQLPYPGGPEPGGRPPRHAPGRADPGRAARRRRRPETRTALGTSPRRSAREEWVRWMHSEAPAG